MTGKSGLPRPPPRAPSAARTGRPRPRRALGGPAGPRGRRGGRCGARGPRGAGGSGPCVRGGPAAAAARGLFTGRSAGPRRRRAPRGPRAGGAAPSPAWPRRRPGEPGMPRTSQGCSGGDAGGGGRQLCFCTGRGWRGRERRPGNNNGEIGVKKMG